MSVSLDPKIIVTRLPGGGRLFTIWHDGEAVRQRYVEEGELDYILPNGRGGYVLLFRDGIQETLSAQY